MDPDYLAWMLNQDFFDDAEQLVRTALKGPCE
jgi:hypothetical protein